MIKYGFTITISFLLLFSLRSNAQSFDYSYVDPCTGVNKTIQVPSNGITLTYYNQVNTFQPADFYNGVFESWSQSVYQNFGNNNPCSKIIGIPGAINIGQQTSLTLFSIINSISSAIDARESALGNTDLLSSSVGSVQKTEGKKSKQTESKQGSSINIQHNSISNTNSNNNSSTTVPSSNNQNSNESSTNSGAGGTNTDDLSKKQSTNSQVGGDNQQSTSEQNQSNTTDGSSKKTDLLGNTVSALDNISSSSNKNGNKPTIVGGGDFVGFNFFKSDIRYGGKFTASYTSMKWDGSSVHGLIIDYTSSINGPNITGFYAKIHKRRIDLISTSATMGFGNRVSLYGTLAIGQMWTIKKNLKGVYLATGSFGNVYQEKFLAAVLVAGGMYDMKINKRFSLKIMSLYVYAPYVSYYNDLLLKSPHVVLPIIGTNINITKTFKFNINAGGAWAVKQNTLNYTVVMGTRLIF